MVGVKLGILKDAVSKWVDDNAQRMAAAIAFYTISSMAPLLIIAIGVAALVFGQQAAVGRMVEQIRDVIGESAAQAVQSMLAGARRHNSGALPTAIGFATLFVTATGLFSELHDSLN